METDRRVFLDFYEKSGICLVPINRVVYNKKISGGRT